VIIAVVQWGRDVRQQGSEPPFSLDQRQYAQVVTVEMQEVEDEIHQPGGVAGVGDGLDNAEGGDAVGVDAAELAVEIRLTRRKDDTEAASARYLCVQSRPVRVSSRTAPRSRRACMR
jgi:hypothetical protein